MDQDSKDSEYFLEVVKVNEEPKWPRPESELLIGSQLLSSGFIQYWAYPLSSNRSETDLPPSENVAQKHKTDRPAILIDQIGPDLLELIVTRDGHVWGRSESSLGNLEDNLSDLLEFSKKKFNIKVEHFMTTDRVSEDAEKKLDQLENNSDPDVSLDTEGTGNGEDQTDLEDSRAEGAKSMGSSDKFGGSESVKIRDNKSPEDDDQPLSFRPVSSSTGHPLPPHGIYSSQGGDNRGSKVWIVLPILILAAVFIGALFFREQILSKISSSRQAEPAPQEVGPTPTETPTPTPTPSLDRGEYKIRVLNGTNQS
ncbi:MAG: hypothetical protein Q7S88_02760, partial [Candidatus Daviesbacteria bacterium]|nr:hypothetical protein [Candidatus Daviesbacteria bacterium]